MLQDRILSRDEFLSLLQLKSTTLDQRIHRHELTFAFACPRLAHIGEYLLWDAFTVLLISMLTGFARIEIKVASGLVSKHWYELLVGVAEAERNMDASPNDRIYFAIGTDLAGRPSAAVGNLQDATDAVESTGATKGPLNMMPLPFVLRKFRENANEAEIDLPDFLTPQADLAPGYDRTRRNAEFEKFLEQVREHQRLAGAKHQAKLKAKKKARATA